MEKLADYQERMMRAGRDAFLKSTPPVLIYRGTTISVPEDESKVFTTHTLQSRGLETSTRIEEGSELTLSTVFPLLKRAGSAYQDRISIGRVRTCDVHMPLARISKFHGYITRSLEQQVFYFTDAGSTNGTCINGKSLVANAVTELPDLCELLLGPYLFHFLTPQSLSEHLRSLPTALRW